MTIYTCQKCGTEAKLINGVPVKQCACVAGMTAHLKATVRGTSSTGSGKRPPVVMLSQAEELAADRQMAAVLLTERNSPE